MIVVKDIARDWWRVSRLLPVAMLERNDWLNGI